MNEFCNYLHELTAWEPLLANLNEDEQLDVLVEFLLPLCFFCLGAPYALKGRLHTSIAEVSHQANRFVLRGWKDNANLTKPTFRTAEKHAKHWTAWSDLAVALSRLSDEAYVKASDDFRNRFNHGFPRHVHLGLTGFMRRELTPTGSVSYALGADQPLRIDQVLPQLAQQYTAALTCYDKYILLLREQHGTLVANTALHGTPRSGRL